MALIIETGAIVADANSYATVAELRAYAALAGIAVPESNNDCEILLIRAARRMRGENYVGRRVSGGQSMDWPRTGAIVEDLSVPSNEIPRNAKYCQLAFAIAAQSMDLMPNAEVAARGPVIEETLGPITTVYANTGNVNRVPAIAEADTLLRTLVYRRGLFAVRA